MSDKIVNTTDADFDNDVLKSDLPVLVDFWAEWCGPCKMIAPVLSELADEFDGKLKIVKYDCGSQNDIAGQLGIRNIPTLMLYKGGESVGQKIGALSKTQLTEFVESAI